VARYLLAGGLLAALMGAALIPPVLVARLESGEQTTLGIGIVSVGCGLVACGVTAVLMGFRQRVTSGMPSGVRASVAANVVFLAFFAFELSDRLVRPDGKLFYWTTFLLPPALLIFCGLLAARPWAWWTSRGAAALGVLWFLGFLLVIPFAPLQADGVPIPWYGRVYVASVTLAFAGILAVAYWSLGRPETRNYFGLIRTNGSATA
jgi:xanthine/uracil/vitamin C permease (AzgA family)